MNNNKILALKYRPQNFGDLIGQDIMAKTIINAIKLGKTPNAYLLTGIRGVGKTTTARLIAKALNCEKNISKEIKCSKDEFCSTCKEIVRSSHIDVLEMDAASKTGIDDVRELIENSKYSPTSAKYKIFIIDEVHMLSKQAFNGLLKTLEEPPPSLKFILATTEVRKIPVTIMSRCQRFDLKRINMKMMFEHLKKIVAQESGQINDNALKIIAQVSEGSVRDAISLLDRALIFQNINSKDEVDEEDIRSMLGLADKSKTIILLGKIFKGETTNAVKILNDLFDNGIDSNSFLNDILEILTLINRKLSLGEIHQDEITPESQIAEINSISKGIKIEDVGLFWQYTIKTIEDLKTVTDEKISLEMYIMQLTHLVSIESKKIIEEENLISNQVNEREPRLAEKEDNHENSSLKIKNQLKNIDQVKTSLNLNPEIKKNSNGLKINSFADIVKLANQENEIELKYDLERNVKLVSFSPRKIDISFNEKLNKSFIKILSERLLLWTGERWIISLSKNIGDKTLFEKKTEEKKIEIKEAKNKKSIKNVLESFEDAELIKVSKIKE